MGEDYEAAHVPARAQTVLTDFDRRSAHYEVLDRREHPLYSSATNPRGSSTGRLEGSAHPLEQRVLLLPARDSHAFERAVEPDIDVEVAGILVAVRSGSLCRALAAVRAE
jgi:hypothetical protein